MLLILLPKYIFLTIAFVNNGNLLLINNVVVKVLFSLFGKSMNNMLALVRIFFVALNCLLIVPSIVSIL